jgi:hypothetical protein
MTKTLGMIADFIIKIMIMFTTVISLLFFAANYPLFSLVFSLMALMMILAIITKGLVDIFSKE